MNFGSPGELTNYLEMMMLMGGSSLTTIVFTILILWCVYLATFQREKIRSLAAFRVGYLMLMLAMILVPAMQIVESRSFTSMAQGLGQVRGEGEAFLQIIYHLLVPGLLAASFTMIMSSLITFSMIASQQRRFSDEGTPPPKHPLDH